MIVLDETRLYGSILYHITVYTVLPSLEFGARYRLLYDTI